MLTTPRKAAWTCLAALGIFVIAGCAGDASNGDDTLQPGFYRGTVQFEEVTGFAGTAPAVAELQENGDFDVRAWQETIAALLTKSGPSGLLTISASVFTGSVTTTARGKNLSFVLRDGQTVFARGSLTKSDLPKLGAQATVPPGGEYRGEFLVVSEGRAVRAGPATATIDETGRWRCGTFGGGDWTRSGFFHGRFQSNGNVDEALLSGGGGTLPQSTSTRYSFDGTTLRVRYDELFLTPGTCWLTLTRS